MPYDAIDIAKFFFKLDKEEKLFPKDKMITINGKTMYEGNIRVNNFLHLSQNIYIAKYGKKLFYNDLYAYVNGSIVRDVQVNYQVLKKNMDLTSFSADMFDDETLLFLKEMFYIFQYAPIEELVEITHEDEEWIECNSLLRGHQIMNPISRAKEYHEQYDDILYLLNQDYILEEITKGKYIKVS